MTTAADQPAAWYYLSFADGERPEGDQFLGGCYVQLPKTIVAMTEGAAVALAVTRAHALGINPGGEVATIGPIPHADLVGNVPTEDRERLLSADELREPERGISRRGGDLTAEDFERAYAERCGMTVEQLRALGRVVRPCSCAYRECEGWQSVSAEAAAEIDDPEQPWAR